MLVPEDLVSIPSRDILVFLSCLIFYTRSNSSHSGMGWSDMVHPARFSHLGSAASPRGGSDVVKNWPLGTLGHNIELLGLGTLDEVGSFEFSLGSLGHLDMAVGGLWDCLGVLRDF